MSQVLFMVNTDQYIVKHVLLVVNLPLVSNVVDY